MFDIKLMIEFSQKCFDCNLRLLIMVWWNF